MAKSRFIIRKTPSRKKERTVTVRDSKGNVETFRTDQSGNVDLRSPASRDRARVSSSRSSDPVQVIQGGVTIPVSEGFAEKIKEVTTQPSSRTVKVKGEPELPSELARLASVEEKQGVRVNRIRNVTTRLSNDQTPREQRIQNFRQQVADQKARDAQLQGSFYITPSEESAPRKANSRRGFTPLDQLSEANRFGSFAIDRSSRALQDSRRFLESKGARVPDIALRGIPGDPFNVRQNSIASLQRQQSKALQDVSNASNIFEYRAGTAKLAGVSAFLTAEQITKSIEDAFKRQPATEAALFAGSAGLKIAGTAGVRVASKLPLGQQAAKYGTSILNSRKFKIAYTAGFGGLAAGDIATTPKGRRIERIGELAAQAAAVGAGFKAGGSVASRLALAKVGRDAAKSVSVTNAALQRQGAKTGGTFKGRAVIDKQPLELQGRIAEVAKGGRFTGYQETTITTPKGKSVAQAETFTAGKDLKDIRVQLSKTLVQLSKGGQVSTKTGAVTKFTRKGLDEIIGRSLILSGAERAGSKFPTFTGKDLARFRFTGLGRTRTTKVLEVSKAGQQPVEFFTSRTFTAQPGRKLDLQRYLARLRKLSQSKRAQIQVSKLTSEVKLPPSNVARTGANVEANLKSLARALARNRLQSNLRSRNLLASPLQIGSGSRSAQAGQFDKLLSQIAKQQTKAAAQQSNALNNIVANRTGSRPTTRGRTQNRLQRDLTRLNAQLRTFTQNTTARAITATTLPAPASSTTVLPIIPKLKPEDIEKEIEKYRASSRGFKIPSLTGFATGFRLPDTGVATISPRFLRPKVRRA